MTIERLVLLAAAVAVAISACGGGEMTLSEYAEELEFIMEDAAVRGEEMTARAPGSVLIADNEDLDDFTPQDLQAGLEQTIELERDLRAAGDAIDPPEALADLHRLFFDTRFATALEPLAARAGTAATWSELSETPEMAAYREAVAGDKQACLEIQAELDATADRGIFADTPWVPTELQEVIDVVVGCSAFPENPYDLYRPPSSSP